MRRTKNQQQYPWLKPEVYYHHLNDICTEIGIEKKRLQRTIGILENLEIIKTKEAPRYKDFNGKWNTNTRIFTDFTTQSDQEIEWCIQTLKKQSKQKGQT